MLQSIREKTQGVVATVLFVLIGLSFVFWGMERFFESNAGDRNLIAKVGHAVVTRVQLDQAVQNLQQEQGINPATLNEAQVKFLRQAALANLVRESAVGQAAEKAGFAMGQDQLQSLIQNFPIFQQDGHFSAQRFQQFYYEGFMRDVSNFVLINQLQSGIAQSVFILPEEVQKNYERIAQKRTFGYFQVPLASFMHQKEPSAEDLQHYYQQHAAEFQLPEQVSIDYLQISAQSARSQLKPLAIEQLHQYYEDNKSLYTTPARWQLRTLSMSGPVSKEKSNAMAESTPAPVPAALVKLGQQLQAGALKPNTALPAKTQLQTKWYNQEQLPPAWIAVLNALSAGQTSEPFQTDTGWMVIQLISIQPGAPKPFAAVQKEVHTALEKQQLEALLSKQNENLANLTYTNPDSLEPAAKVLGVPVQTTPLFTRQFSARTGVLAVPEVVAAAFSADVLTTGNNSNPISLPDGSELVLRIHQHVPGQTQPLTAVKTTIRQRLMLAQATQQAADVAYKLQKALESGVSPSQLSRDYHLPWHEMKAVDRETTQVPSPILKVGFDLPLAGLSATGSTALPNGDMAVVRVSDPKPGDFLLASAQKKQILTDKLTALAGQLDYQLYVKSVMDHTKVKIEAIH